MRTLVLQTMDFQSIVVDVGIVVAYVAIVVPGASSAVIADAGAASTRVAGTVAGADAAVAAATGMVVAAGVSVGAGTGAIVGVGMIVVGMRIEMGMRYAIKYAIRAIMIRLFATLRFLFLTEFGRCPKIGGKIISSSIP